MILIKQMIMRKNRHSIDPPMIHVKPAVNRHVEKIPINPTIMIVIVIVITHAIDYSRF